ncbi:MAG: glycosyltransferase family protein [Candidatus Marinimicrobia bacterium]|nr:glycosyltransferase family protein [Candidatus Neomarinimicrobiota bacterium]
MQNRTILYAVINWGLGHVTRSAPLIRHLLGSGNRVVLVSHGKALAFLRKEFPGCTFRDVRDRKIDYTRFPFMFVFKIVSQLPKMCFGWGYERKKMRELEREFRPDLIISEMRLGFWSKRIPSVLITHQLRFHLPPGLRWAEIFGEWFNFLVFRKYDNIFVPDTEGKPNLSGDLSHKGRIARHPKVRYVGCLSSIVPAEDTPEKDIDLLVSISGPEPQRSRFEAKVMEQVKEAKGRIVVALGEPEFGKDRTLEAGRVRIYSHLDRNTMADVMQRAKYIVCRSGYSTVMELLALQRSALLVPTPGQTEQEYLAGYYQREGLFDSCSQDALDLKHLEINPVRQVARRNIPVNRLNDIGALLDKLCK